MRGSAALVAVIVAIGIAATVDALRDSGSPAPVRETVATQEAPPARAPAPEDALREAGVSGRLYFTLETDDGCTLYILNLPTLRNVGGFLLDSCWFDLSQAGEVVVGSPCPSRYVEVYSAEGTSQRWNGCAPAWKPDGTLTFVSNGDLVTPKGILVRNVARFARNALGSGSRLRVEQLAWLTDRRLAVRVGTRTVQSSVVVVIEDGRAVSEPLFADRNAQLEISHATEEILVTFSGGGVQVFDPNGEFISANRFPFGSIAAVTYAPSGRWVALARQGNICIYEETDPPPRERFPVACVPFEVVDLAWG